MFNSINRYISGIFTATVAISITTVFGATAFVNDIVSTVDITCVTIVAANFADIIVWDTNPADVVIRITDYFFSFTSAIDAIVITIGVANSVGIEATRLCYLCCCSFRLVAHSYVGGIWRY